jgi:hypothetical protein
MRMIEPIHGQPPSGYHAPPNPIHYHILGLTTNLVFWREITMPNLTGMNVEALMKLRNQVDERLLFVAIGVGGAIALAIIGYLLNWISA